MFKNFFKGILYWFCFFLFLMDKILVFISLFFNIKIIGIFCFLVNCIFLFKLLFLFSIFIKILCFFNSFFNFKVKIWCSLLMGMRVIWVGVIKKGKFFLKCLFKIVINFLNEFKIVLWIIIGCLVWLYLLVKVSLKCLGKFIFIWIVLYCYLCFKVLVILMLILGL